MHRFLGGSKGMDTVDKIQAILLNYYKPVTAAKLVSFWLYVQQFGSAKAKTDFGKTSYYYQRRQLKKAGVGLIEIDENLIRVDPEFFRNFKLDIPSEYVYKRTDEFRTNGNLLNLPPQQNQGMG